MTLLINCSQFVFFSTGDAFGEGLAAGLGVAAGAVTELLGEATGDGDDVPEFELSAGSQAAANRVNRIVGTSSARLIDFVIELLIRFCLVRTRLKSRRMLLERAVTSNGCSHRSCTGISPLAELKPSFSKECLHDLRTRARW
jgi:hypothetical protein